MVCDNLRVNGGLEDRTCILQIVTQFIGIDQVSVVCQRQCTFDIVQYQRLRIFSGGSSGSRITHMSYADVTFQTLQIFCVKHLIDKPHILETGYFSLRSLCLADRDTAALLSTVLQGEQSIINARCHIMSV